MACEVDNVAPRRGLSTGEMHMQRAERGRFAEHLLPGFAVKFIAGALKRHRIGAIETAKRATMGQFDQKPDRRGGRGGGGGGHFSRPLFGLGAAGMGAAAL